MHNAGGAAATRQPSSNPGAPAVSLPSAHTGVGRKHNSTLPSNAHELLRASQSCYEMDALAQNHLSYSSSFPTSWAVAANGPSTSPPLPPPPPRQRPPPVHTPSLRTTSSSSSSASTSKYLTHFPSSWLLPSAASHAQSQLAPEPKNRANDLDTPERQSFTNSTFHSQMTLRPLFGESQGLSDPPRWPVQGEDFKQRLLTTISRSMTQDTSERVPSRGDQKNTSSTISVPAPMQKGKEVARLPDGSYNGCEWNLQVGEDGYDSDRSGLGDAPYQPLDFMDTYSIYSASSALTNRK